MELTGSRGTRVGRARRAGAVLLTTLLVASAASASLVGAATKTKAWIDQPLPGAILPLGSAAVTLHAASPVGISQIRVLVDGVPATNLPAPTGELVTVDWTWLPPAPGLYLLTVVADGTDGLPSDPASVAVTFVATDDLPPTPPPRESPPVESPGASGAPTTPPASAGPTPTAPGATPQPTPPGPTPTSPPGPTPTPPPGPTPTPTPPRPTPTPVPTPAPCSPLAPTLLVPGDGQGVDPEPTLEWFLESNGCDPTAFRVQVSTSRTFDTIVQQATVPPDQSFWTAGPDLEACVTHSWRVQAKAPSGTWGPFSDAWTFYVYGRSCAP